MAVTLDPVALSPKLQQQLLDDHAYFTYFPQYSM